MDTNDLLISLDEVGRTSRAPDYRLEAEALRQLAEALSEDPGQAFLHLAQTVVSLGMAESAGVSIISSDGTRFIWPAIAGVWARYTGGGLPFNASPCGVVVKREMSLLFRDPHLCFPDAGAADPLIRHVLLAPLRSGGRVVGTLWALTHSDARRFDAEDARLLESLAKLAGAAFRLTTSLEAERQTHGALSEAHVALSQAHAALKQISENQETRVEQALAEKKVFAEVIERSSAAVTVLSPDFTILAINSANVDAFERAFGVRPCVGDHLLTLLDGKPVERSQLEGIWSRALAGETFVVTDEFGYEDRDRRYFEVRLSPLLNRQGELSGASSTAYDVTDRVLAEAQRDAAQEQLRHAQKMEAMGELTGGVAHDFNNLLQPIVISLDVLRRGLGDEERRQRLISAALKSADRARTLVQRLLAFARRQPLQSTRVDVAALVTDMVELVRSTLGPQVELQLALDAGLPAAIADVNQLEMALLNLCVNARDAMPNGGSLRIGAAGCAIETMAAHRTGLPPGRYVRLSVADSGHGMDEATLRRAVEPFFSTKGVGKGTGLGLSMVEGLARQLQGALTIDSTVGHGTRMTLWLPASDQQAEVTAAPQDSMPTRGGAGVVLLVDDEDLVRLTTADMLGELGFDVVEAASADEALTRLLTGLRPDLVVTDHLMAGMSGTDLARRLAQDWPDVPTLIVSGYADIEGIERGFHRLTKPYGLDELSASLLALGVLGKGTS